MAVDPLQSYTNTSIAEQIGVVRLQDDATALTRNLIQATGAIADTATTITKHAEAEYIASFQLDQRKKAAEMQVKHALDPASFQKEWQAHGEGTLNSVPAAFRGRAALALKSVGQSTYEDVLGRTATNTRNNAVSSWDAERKLKEADYLSKARGRMEGTSTPAQAEAARIAYSLHLEDGVRLKVVDEKMTDIARNELVVKAQLEVVEHNTKRAAEAEFRRPEAPPATPPSPASGESLMPGGDVAARIGEAGARNWKPMPDNLVRTNKAIGDDKSGAPTTPAAPPPATTDTPGSRARKVVDRMNEDIRTDPLFAPVRANVTPDVIESRVRRIVAEAEAEHERARALNNEKMDAFVTRLSNGLTIEATEAQAHADEARRLGDRRGAAKWDMIVTKGAALAEFSQMPMQQQAADLQATLAKAQANPKDDSALFEYQVKQQVAERARAAYRADSFTYAKNAYGRDQGQAANIDFTKPDAGELARRREMVGVLESRAGAEVSPFSAEEMSRYASTWNAASAQDKSRIAATLNAGLGPKLAARVMGTLSKDGHVDRASVFAASLAERGEGVIAREIFEGLDVLKTEQRAPKHAEFDRRFNEYVGTAYKHGIEAGDGAAKAVQARLAKWAKDNGKLGEEVPTDIQDQYIKSTIGEIVTHNRSRLFPPRRDMTQREFDAIIAGVRDQDAPLLRASDGAPVTITKALKSGALESVGDGRYTIRFGENYYLPDARGRPFILEREFFQRVETRRQYEDFGAFTAGNPASPRLTGREGKPWRPDAAPAPDWMRE